MEEHGDLEDEHDLLGKRNACGQTLLQLVARGSAVVSEILKLSDAVPSVFQNSGNAQSKCDLVIFDFTYLKMQERFEERISADESLLARDLELQMRYAQLVDRFYLLFRAIVRYHRQLSTFWQDLESGFYIQYSVEEILMDRDGAQLMSEALYQYGVMLSLLELKLVPAVRERLVVFALRARGEAKLADLDAVLLLAKSDDFSRLRVDVKIARMIASKLELDDLYAMRRAFPRPDDRTTALGQQAAMLFVVLRFCPEILREGRASMRAIVDRFFSDNWVIPIHMGTWVNLRVAWREFPAAFAALEDAQEPPKNFDVREVQTSLDRFLVKGVLTDKFVLENLQRLLRVVRRSNVMIRWFMLHRAADSSLIAAKDLVELVLSAAQLEFIVKTKLKALHASKRETWASSRELASKRMGELCQYFTGTMALSRVQRNDTLVAWFTRIGSEIDALDHTKPTLAGRRIQKLVLALREVEKVDEIDTSLHVKQFLADSRELLLQMVRVVALDEALLANLDLVTDMSYAWELIADYMDLLHARIRKDPGSIQLLRATFLKLASILDVPLTRISQADSPDAPVVAAYYSGELVRFVQRVLSVIPRTMFDMLMQVTDLLVERLPAVPTRLEASKLREFSQAETRFRVAELSHWVSVFTEGVLAMQTTLLGVVEVDPRQLLEDGIRTELVSRVCAALDQHFTSPRSDGFGNITTKEMERQLVSAAASMKHLRHSLEFVQDYVSMNGLRVWHMELERIFGVYADVEVKNRPPSPGELQVPVHRDSQSITFLRRLEQMLYALTQADTSVYAPRRAAWLDMGSRAEVLGARLLRHLKEAVGVPAMKACGGTSRASAIVSWLVSLGRSQLLRIGIKHELCFTAQIESSLVYASSEVAKRRALAARAKVVCQENGDAEVVSPVHDVGHDEEKNSTLQSLLDRCGLSEPLCQQFGELADATSLSLDVPALLVIVLVDVLPRLQFDGTFSTLIPHGKHVGAAVNGYPLAAGLATVLAQLPNECTVGVLSGLGAYVRGCISEAFHARSGSKILAPGAVAAVHFVDAFVALTDVDSHLVAATFPVQCRAHLHLLHVPKLKFVGQWRQRWWAMLAVLASLVIEQTDAADDNACVFLLSNETCESVLGDAACAAAAVNPQAGSLSSFNFMSTPGCLSDTAADFGIPSNLRDQCINLLQFQYVFQNGKDKPVDNDPPVTMIVISILLVLYFIVPFAVFLAIAVLRIQFYQTLSDEDDEAKSSKEAPPRLMDTKSLGAGKGASKNGQGAINQSKDSKDESSADVTEESFPVYLSFHKLSYNVPLNKSAVKSAIKENGGKKPSTPGWDRKLILDNITGVFEPKTLSAIMGPSGCGKSTLLDILADRKHGGTTRGKVLVNGRPRSAMFKRVSGYVMQFDSLFPHLTVSETLRYTAELRITGTDLKDKKEAVAKVIRDLDLKRVAHSRVGGNGVPGISGGQARRVTVGIELITRPLVLFLDEPTTGLDSFSSLQLVRTLRVLADTGRTVVATIHQPRPDIFELFDLLLLMKSGRIAYFGPVLSIGTYFGNLGIHIPEDASVADFVVDLTYSGEGGKDSTSGSNIVAELADSFVGSAAHRRVWRLAEALEKRSLTGLPPPAASQFTKCNPDTGAILDSSAARFSQSIFRQLFILLRRSYKNMSRDRTYFLNVGIQMVQFLFYGLLFLGLRTESVDSDAGDLLGISNLSFLIMFQKRAFLFQVMNTIMLIEVVVIGNAFVEKKIFRREHASGAYSVAAYHGQFIVRFYVDAIWKGLVAAVLSYFFPPMRLTADGFFFYAAVLMVCSTFGAGLAFLMVSLVPDAEGASNIHAQILGTFGLYSGYFLVGELYYPVWMRWLYSLLPFRYSFEALELNEFTCLTEGEQTDILGIPLTLNRWTSLFIFMIWPPALHFGAMLFSFLYTRPSSFWSSTCSCCSKGDEDPNMSTLSQGASRSGSQELETQVSKPHQDQAAIEMVEPTVGRTSSNPDGGASDVANQV
ncbi:ABC transporter G family member 5 [Hondaea fermentalgiana]|uniref:ABC transporter G family member 5 n=1 Tax=Hondaea fermentalgiana TaxID=2315210 RepID=A0A2R5GQP4_9STRA|nr:ABC transporter G family member 5 [Hondaea fermentalgiana]|eukprot:GBG30204.1 ABC transporter G family member 5 [Hondaea fermentalgiana]